MIDIPLLLIVVPAKAGTQLEPFYPCSLDSRVRGGPAFLDDVD